MLGNLASLTRITGGTTGGNDMGGFRERTRLASIFSALCSPFLRSSLQAPFAVPDRDGAPPTGCRGSHRHGSLAVSPASEAHSRHSPMYALPSFGGMVGRGVRYAAYAAALRKAVQNTSTVLDIGCGPGFWAITAARCGAARVYAIEPDEQHPVGTGGRASPRPPGEDWLLPGHVHRG